MPCKLNKKKQDAILYITNSFQILHIAEREGNMITNGEYIIRLKEAFSQETSESLETCHRGQPVSRPIFEPLQP